MEDITDTDCRHTKKAGEGSEKKTSVNTTISMFKEIQYGQLRYLKILKKIHPGIDKLNPVRFLTAPE